MDLWRVLNQDDDDDQGTSESKEIIFNDGLQFIYVRIEQFIFLGM